MIKMKIIKIGRLLLYIWVALYLGSCAQLGSKPKPSEAPRPGEVWYDIATMTTHPPEIEEKLFHLFNPKDIRWAMHGSIVWALIIPDSQTEIARELLESDPYFMKMVSSGELVFAETYSPNGAKRIKN
jgi:hypothetical protein